MNQIAPVAPRDEDALIPVLQSSLYPGASADSIRLALGYCRAAGLDPMLKPVHIVPMWDRNEKRMRDTIMPGIGLYRIQAARSGAYAGKSEPEFGPIVTLKLGGKEYRVPEWCKVTIRRVVAGHVCEFTAKEWWIENYATAGKDTDEPNAMWAKRARGQLAKCAEAQALRMAFPELVGAQPTAEEMEGKDLAPLPPARGPVVDHAPAEPEAPEWQSMQWPVCDRSGKCRDMGDPDAWEAEMLRRIEVIQTNRTLDAAMKPALIRQVRDANRAVVEWLCERGYAERVEGVVNAFRAALGEAETAQDPAA
jgi:phage recombination protein Bet